MSSSKRMITTNFKKEMKLNQKNAKITRNDRVRMKEFEKKQTDTTVNKIKKNVRIDYDPETRIYSTKDCVWQVIKDLNGNDRVGFISIGNNKIGCGFI